MLVCIRAMALRTIPLATLDLVRALGVQNLEVLLLADVTAEGLVVEVLHVHLILRLATLSLVRVLGVESLEVLLLADVTAEGLVLEVLHVHLILRLAAGVAMALEGVPTVRAEGAERASERLGTIIIILRLLEETILLPSELGDALLLRPPMIH